MPDNFKNIFTFLNTFSPSPPLELGDGTIERKRTEAKEEDTKTREKDKKIKTKFVEKLAHPIPGPHGHTLKKA